MTRSIPILRRAFRITDYENGSVQHAGRAVQCSCVASVILNTYLLPGYRSPLPVLAVDIRYADR